MNPRHNQSTVNNQQSTIQEDQGILALSLVFILALSLIFGGIFLYCEWAGAASTYTDRFGLEMPAQGDVAWDDAIRVNHKIFEVVVGPLIDGHSVKSGCTPSELSGLTVQWSAGTVRFEGVDYTLAAGNTICANNTYNWLSAVSMSPLTGATVELRSTEYYPPSSASGYYVPLAFITTEAGSIVRLKDLRVMPKGGQYTLDQDLDTGASPTFGKVYVTDQTDTNNLNVRSGITFPSGTSPSVVNYQVAIDSNEKLLVTLINGVVYTVQLEKTYNIPILSPDIADDPNQIPLFTIGGQTGYLTGATFYASESGITIEGLVYSADQYNFQFGAGTTIFNFIDMATAGTSVWYVAYGSGETVIPPNRTLLMDFGAGAPAWIKADLTIRYEGSKP